jgi:succinate-semialdehyde dehydrogenase/glutarate-semialdehyde dehydrogenase
MTDATIERAPHGNGSPPATETVVVRDPATGEAIARLHAAGERVVRAEVAAVRDAAPAWARSPAAERASVLKRWAQHLAEHADELARLQTREMGRPLGESHAGVLAGIGAIEQYAELGPLHRGRRLHGAPDADDAMERRPRGVAAIVLPWNDPVALACGQLAACLVMGNTVVVKPSERAPLAVARAVELLEQDAPAGIVRLVHGDAGTGAALVGADGVDLVLHTGSVAAGRAIALACAQRLRKAVLELGGKDALIVDDRVEPAWAAEQAAHGAFANAGQVCTSVERIYVHTALAERFTEELVRRAQALRVGPGLDPASEMGPLVDRRQQEQVHAHVQEAVAAGARVRCGGAIPGGPGSFYPPTVLDRVTPAMRIMREETFGPVAPIMAVESFDAALAHALETDYGLAATVLTRDERHARRACRELDVGTVKVNAVWGGAPGGAAEPRRMSGLGLGYGPELLDEVSAWRVVHREAAP